MVSMATEEGDACGEGSIVVVEMDTLADRDRHLSGLAVLLHFCRFLYQVLPVRMEQSLFIRFLCSFFVPLFPLCSFFVPSLFLLCSFFSFPLFFLFSTLPFPPFFTSFLFSTRLLKKMKERFK